uniref:Uncharacterized protein n=1 Tax=Anguilla anguilla TaxID=7936 RepID=A0A0E9SWA6_ANGAN
MSRSYTFPYTWDSALTRDGCPKPLVYWFSLSSAAACARPS